MFVTRAAYDALQRECDRWATMYETLLEKYHALKVQGHSPRPAESPAVTAPPPSDEDVVTQFHKNAAIDSMAKDLHAREGLAPDVALAEATRAIESLFAPTGVQ